MLRSVDEDDSGGESETEEDIMLDWKLCSSDEMSDDEEAEQFDDTQPIVHIDDLQTAETNLETYSALCSEDDSSLGAAKSSSTHETSRDSTKLEFMKFGAEAQGRRTA